MITDIRTVFDKELLEMRRGSGRGGVRSLMGMVVISLVVSVVIPYSVGSDTFGALGYLAVGGLLATTWVLTTVPDAFAGERDRSTLETLLSSRLPAPAILLGKMTATAAFAAGIGVVALVLSAAASNVGGIAREHQHGIQVRWGDLALGLVIVVLVAILLTNIGVLVALRAASAMSAQRMLGIGLAGIILASTTGISSLPKRYQSSLLHVVHIVGALPTVILLALGVAVYLLLNLAIFRITLSRFTRPKLLGV